MAMGQINKGTLETKKGAEAPFDCDDVTGTSYGECEMERVEGIEPSSIAWEAIVLPINYTRFEARLFTRTLLE